MKKIISFLLILISVIFLNLMSDINSIKPVNACRLQKKIHSDYITVSGEFENQNRTEIKLSYPACIKEVYVKENQLINKGQALFSIDTDKMEAFINGNLDENLINRLNFEDISYLKNYSSFIDINDIPGTVYSSETGTVTELNIYPGAVVLNNKTLVSISSAENVLARFSVSQLDYGKIGVGDSVDIIPVAFSDVSYSGKISDKNAVIKKQISATGGKVVIDVFAEIENPDKRVSGGLQINGKICSGDAREILTLEHQYINQDNEGEYVFFLNRGKAEKIYIETGIESENYTEIITTFPENTVFISGDIKEGDRVIITG